MPVRESKLGLGTALLITETFADLAPVELGVKFALKVQDAPPARLLAPNEQGDVPVAESTKSPALVPVTAMLVRFSCAVPEFDRVITVGALGMPTG